MDAPLHTDLGRAQIPRLDRATRDLLRGQEIRLASEVEGLRTLRERAEPAPEIAEVRVIDVPVDDVGDLVADRGAPEVICDRIETFGLATFGRKEKSDLVLGEFLTQL